MLNLSSDKWHIKVFKWCYQVSVACWRKNPEFWMDDYKRTNLCQYIRTIFVAAPLALLLNLAFWLWVGFVFLYWPILHMGFGSYAIGIAVLIGGLAAAVGVIYCGVESITYVSKFCTRRQVARRNAPPKEPGMLSLVWQYVRDRHNQFCVNIKIEDKKP